MINSYKYYVSTFSDEDYLLIQSLRDRTISDETLRDHAKSLLESLERDYQRVIFLFPDLEITRLEDRYEIAEYELSSFIVGEEESYYPTLKLLFYWLTYPRDLKKYFYLYYYINFTHLYYIENGINIHDTLSDGNVSEFFINFSEDSMTEIFIIETKKIKHRTLKLIDQFLANQTKDYLVIERFQQ